MSEINSKLSSIISFRNEGLIKVGNSIQLTNKILDEYSKRLYKPRFSSIILGTQEWMVENLSIVNFRNGEPIYQAKTVEDWKMAAQEQRPAWCYRGFDIVPHQYYKGNNLTDIDRERKLELAKGKDGSIIYNWYAITDPRGLAPDGWHIPIEDEWLTMINYIDANKTFKTREFYYDGLWCENRINTYGNAYMIIGCTVFFVNSSFQFPNSVIWKLEEKSISEVSFRDIRSKGVNLLEKGRDKVGFKVRCLRNQQIKINSIPQDFQFRSVLIGDNEWMQENLFVECFRNGDLIAEVKTVEDWYNAEIERRPVWCYYDNLPIYGKRYGKLYNLHTIIDTRGLAPIGWHIPNNDEWKSLLMSLGKSVGRKLKSTGGWDNYEINDYGSGKMKTGIGNGTNSSGFDALPGGGCFFNYKSSCKFQGIGSSGVWWSSELDNLIIYSSKDRCSWHPKSDILLKNGRYFIRGASVRCIKD